MIIILKHLKNLLQGNHGGPVSIITLMLVLTTFPQLASSQNEDVGDTIVPVPQPLIISQIPEYTYASGRLVKNVSDLVKQNEELNNIQKELTLAGQDISTKLQLLKDSSVVYRLDGIDKELREIDLISERVDKWKRLVTQWSDDAQLKNIKIDSLLDLGLLSLEFMKGEKEEKITESDTLEKDSAKVNVIIKLTDDLNSSISELTLAQSNLNIWINKIQPIENMLTVTFSEINAAKTLLDDRGREMAEKIWIPEYPPIWNMEQYSVYVHDEPKIILVLQNSIGIVRDFLKNNRDLPYQAGFALIVFLGLILYLKFNSSYFFDAHPEQYNTSAVILHHPVLSSLILTWFAISLFAELPIELTRFIALFMLIPISIMFWLLDKDRAWYKSVVFIVFYLLFLIIHFLSYFPIVQRITLLFIGIGAISVLYWIKKRKDLLDDVKDLWFGLLPFTIRLFMMFSVVGLLSNILGAVQLSQILSTATLGTFIFFIIYSEAILLSRAFLYLILLGPLFKKSLILQEDSEIVLNKVNSLLKIIGFSFWVYTILSLLTIWKDVWITLKSILNTPFTFGEVSISLGNVLAFFITIQISLWLSSFIRYILNKEIFPRTEIKVGVSNTISMTIRFTFIILGFILALGAAGIPFDKLAIALGALGVGVGFGLQHIVNNFISGIIIAIERPIQIGDTVEVDSVNGIVKDIGFRASQICTWDGAEVIIPNGKLLSESLMNRTLSNRRRRLTVDVRVPFDSDIEAVERILIETTKNQPDIMQDPGPYTNFEGIGESAMKIKVYFWIENTSDLLRLANSVRIAVYNALQKAGFEIPVPRSEVLIENKQDSGMEG
jgi:small-conductance mechanosensitive channel